MDEFGRLPASERRSVGRKGATETAASEVYVRDTIKVYDTNVRRDAAARINKFKRDLEKKIDKIREDLTKGVYNKDTDEKIVKMRADMSKGARETEDKLDKMRFDLANGILEMRRTETMSKKVGDQLAEMKKAEAIARGLSDQIAEVRTAYTEWATRNKPLLLNLHSIVCRDKIEGLRSMPWEVPSAWLLNTGTKSYVAPYDGKLRLLQYAPTDRVSVSHIRGGTRLAIGPIDTSFYHFDITAGDELQFMLRSGGEEDASGITPDSFLFSVSYEYILEEKKKTDDETDEDFDRRPVM